MGAWGTVQHTGEERGEEAGVVIPSPLSHRPSASRVTFQRLQRELPGRGTESDREKEAGEN